MFNYPIRFMPKLWLPLLVCLTLLTWLAYDSAPTSAAAPPSQPAARPVAQAEAEWTIMLYEDADDEILEQDMMIDLNEAERVGSTDQVNIVAQVDRNVGAFDGMGDWTSTKRFYLTQDDNLDEIGSEELADLGELNMADGQTLTDFITWAVTNFPAKKYALVLSDHGAGWPGGFSDPDPAGTGPDDIFLAQAMGQDQLWLMEIDRALEEARSQTGLDQFEFVGFDACLMAQLEVFNALAPHAHYTVASQETEPALGWAYTGFLTELVNNPSMDGGELGKHIVDAYIDQDQRIVDDAARQTFVSEAYGFEGNTTSQEVAEISGKDVTLTAVDLTAIPAVNTALDNLAASLVAIDPSITAQARAYAQAFTSVFGDEMPSPYIDLANFAQLATKLSGDAQVGAATDELMTALTQAIVAEKNGSERPGAAGVTIYFPTSELFNVGDNFGYATVASRFAEATKWDEFLNFHYIGTGAEAVATSPDAQPTEPAVDLEEEYGGFVSSDEQLAQAEQSAAGSKPLQMAPLTLSAEVASIGQAVNLKTEVSGSGLAYIYTFIGRILPEEEKLIIEDKDFVFADENSDVDGVVYPTWPEGGVSIDYDWEPYIYAISDGTDSVRALLEPDTYDAESPTYSTDGIYAFAGSEEKRYATLYFRDNELTEVLGFTGGDANNGDGNPREITPRPGDQFTVLEQGFDLSDQAEDEDFSREGGTLTFSSTPFTIEQIPAPAGSYLVGFIAEDADGKTEEKYESLFVENEDASAVEGFKSYANETLGFALLYPADWVEPVEDLDNNKVSFANADDSTFALIYKESYPDANSTQEANDQAIQANIDFLNQAEGLENLQFTSDVTNIIVGGFDGREVDFTFEQNGQPQSGFVVVTTPTPGVTYSMLLGTSDADRENAINSFNTMLANFDILISGVSKDEVGAVPPDFDESVVDDFTDPASGLVNAEEAQDWGRGYYSDDEQYIVELNPYAGPIYDYYEGQTLGDDFMLQVTTSYEGTNNNGYGLVFQVSDQGYYAFSISGDGYYTVERVDGQESKTLIDWTSSELINLDELGDNVLTVVGQGNTYNLYLNGQQVNSFSDDTHSGGTFGIVTNNFDEQAPATFHFDDLTVGTPAQ